LQALTRELAATLDRQSNIAATLPEAVPAKGKRGDALAIGTILLQLVGSGGVIVSLVGVLKTWFERKPTLELELQRPDGAKFRLHAESLGSDEIAHFRQQLDNFIEGQPWPNSATPS
jgi:hypothetical protein